MRIKRFFTCTVSLIAVLSISLFIIEPTSAVSLKTLRIEGSVSPGDQIAKIIEVKNDQEDTIVLYPSIEGFTDAGDESGHPRFVPIDDDLDDLPNWIRFNEEFYQVDPGQTIEVPFIINIPESASPGGHYATIFFTNDPPSDDSSEVKIGTKIGTLVILDVFGEVKEGGYFESLEKKDGFFYNHLPVTFVSRIKNEGNVHFKPQGVIKIKNSLGITTAEIPFNTVNGNVLPLSIRRFEDTWVKNDEIKQEGFLGNLKSEWENFGFGFYSAHAIVDIGRNEPHIIEAKTRFVVFPWRMVLIFLVVISCLSVVLKLYDASVVSRAQKHLEKSKKKRKK